MQHTTPPVRGTQSFVGVMATVWRRPSLTALEVGWRWAAGAPLLAVLAWEVMRAGRSVTVNWSALEAMTVFRPVAALRALDAALAAVLPAAKPVAMWFVPLVFVVWIVAGALGRRRVLRRLDARLGAPAWSLMALGAARAVVLAAVWVLWIWGVRWAGQVAITGPSQHGREPSVVVFCALLICGTLGLFVAWAVASWMLHLAPLAALLRGPNSGIEGRLGGALRAGSLRSRSATGSLRGKLIETNLVMGIVKIALLVLAMVFSACPLPFASVETQTFLVFWWCGVGLVYLVALDYFHVVHSAAYVALWRAYDNRREL